MIWFRKIRWKNFISSGTQWIEIQLDSSKTSLIVGENGAGKSTLLDALSFVLYGKPFRNVLKNQLLNTINNKDCVVELWFSIGEIQYIVRRGIKPNIFEVYRNDELINQDADSKEYQEQFEKHIFKVTYSAFPQVVALGSASFVPFMQLDKKDRSKMIEGLLGTEIFSVMATLLKDKVSSNKQEVIQVDAYIAAVEKTIETEKRRNEERKVSADEAITEKRVKIDALDQQILEADLHARAAQSEADSLRDQLKDEQAAKDRSNQIAELKGQLSVKCNTLKKLHDSNTCPTCRQSITSEIRESHQTKVGEYSNAISQLDQEDRKLHDQLKQFERTREWLIKFESSVRESTGKIALWQSLKRDIEGDIEKIQRQTERSQGETGDLANAERELKEYQNEREKLIKDRNVNEFANILLKDTGIKTKIVKLYIPIINKLVNKYLASMDFFVNFELDENFQEKVKSRFRDEFSYDSFSQGEKARLDLALLFTWRAIAKMRNSASTNLLILDEVFDGSLDAQGNEELLKILHTLTTENNVFVITHKIDAFVEKFERVIRFEKHKNFTRLVESV